MIMTDNEVEGVKYFCMLMVRNDVELSISFSLLAISLALTVYGVRNYCRMRGYINGQSQWVYSALLIWWVISDLSPSFFQQEHPRNGHVTHA